jgi:hypothetical protein
MFEGIVLAFDARVVDQDPESFGRDPAIGRRYVELGDFDLDSGTPRLAGELFAVVRWRSLRSRGVRARMRWRGQCRDSLPSRVPFLGVPCFWLQLRPISRVGRSVCLIDAALGPGSSPATGVPPNRS